MAQENANIYQVIFVVFMKNVLYIAELMTAMNYSLRTICL